MSAVSFIHKYYGALWRQVYRKLQNLSALVSLCFELAGSARCAGDLYRMGYKKEAQKLLTHASTLKKFS